MGGWDAWNVAEDADLGLRLARFGYRTETFSSATYEDAPLRAGVWFRQRRRWIKGWMQTAIVTGRDAGRIVPAIGVRRSLILALMLVSLVIGPLSVIPLSALSVWQILAYGFPLPHGLRDCALATLWTGLFAAGTGATVWSGHAGAKARRLKTSWPHRAALLPYQLLIGAAAWGALFDLLWRPFHWHKTPHDAPVDPYSEAGVAHAPRLAATPARTAVDRTALRLEASVTP